MFKVLAVLERKKGRARDHMLLVCAILSFVNAWCGMRDEVVVRFSYASSFSLL